MNNQNNAQSQFSSYAVFLWTCCAIGFTAYFGPYMRMPIVPLFARSLGASTILVGLINSSFLLMTGLLSIPCGILSDRLGRKLFIVMGLLVVSMTSFLLCLSSSPHQLIGLYFLFGLGFAAVGPTMMSVVADFSPTTHLGRSYGWYTTAIYGGMSLGPAVGGFVAGSLGYSSVFVISGLFTMFTAALTLFCLPRRPVHARAIARTGRKTLDKVKDLLHNRSFCASCLATFSVCFGMGMFITFMPLHAQEHGIGVFNIGLVFATQAICNALSRIPFGAMSDRISNRSHMVLAGLIGFSISIASLGASTTVVTFTLSTIGIGFSLGVTFTALGALVSESVSKDSRGLSMGLYNSCIYLGMMASSGSMGVVSSLIGFRDTFFATALFTLVAAFLFLVLFRGVPARGTTVAE
ncbi:MAG: MFS transporter [Acidobacteriota bacterium]